MCSSSLLQAPMAKLTTARAGPKRNLSYLEQVALRVVEVLLKLLGEPSQAGVQQVIHVQLEHADVCLAVHHLHHV